MQPHYFLSAVAVCFFPGDAESFSSLARTRHGLWLKMASSRRTIAASAKDTGTGVTTTVVPHVLSLRDHLVAGAPEDNVESSSPSIRLILASQSPRRAKILNLMGLEGRYDMIPSPLDESNLQAELRGNHSSSAPLDPEAYTKRLALEKARALADQLVWKDLQCPTIVLGSDTVVAWNGTILEKPRSTEEAVRVLSSLSDQDHVVHTGVAVLLLTPQTTPEIQVTASFCDTTTVQFAPLSLEDIRAYVATGEPMDKAGSYGIQGLGGQFVAALQGDYFTVMGLPMHRTSQELSRCILMVKNT